ncbi:MAG TPA: transporter substrate-binding domain-containing protein [Xanthobacteraceae bacterium]|jgi:polar amino acid transport system substrate-binding protein
MSQALVPPSRATASVLLLALAAHLVALPAHADELDEIKARDTLMVGVAETSPPFSFRDGDRGIVGYDVDLAAAVAKSLGVKMTEIPVINAGRIPALRDAKVDLVASGMTRSAGRAHDIDFSLAYFVSPHKILVRRASGLARISELAGRTLALVRSASVDRDLKAAVPTLRIVFFEDYLAAFTALREKRVDSFLADELLLLRFAQRSGAADDFALIGDYTLPRTAGFGLRKNEPRFKQEVDRTLLGLEASGTAAHIFDAWFSPLRRPFHFQSE